MTGHGHASASRAGVRADVEVSSINRKQLDLVMNLPRALQALEPDLTAALRKAVTRGRVVVTVQVAGAKGSSVVRLVFNEELAASFLKTARRAARTIGLSGELSLSDLLRLPGMVVVEEAGADVKAAAPLVRRALQDALAGLKVSRETEGRALARDLERRVGLLRKAVAKIRRRAPASVREHRDTLTRRLAALAPGLAIDPDRLEREVVLFADRCDVTEELTRLESHLDQALALMAAPGPSGKSLDFLAQELLREINTVGSKSSDRDIAHAVVAFKTELERFREQVQNIE